MALIVNGKALSVFKQANSFGVVICQYAFAAVRKQLKPVRRQVLDRYAVRVLYRWRYIVG